MNEVSFVIKARWGRGNLNVNVVIDKVVVGYLTLTVEEYEVLTRSVAKGKPLEVKVLRTKV
jgi:hypothetical protein